MATKSLHSKGTKYLQLHGRNFMETVGPKLRFLGPILCTELNAHFTL